MICIFGKKVTVQKHLPVLMILLLGLSTSLIGCSSSPTTKTIPSTPTAAVTTPPLESNNLPSDSKTSPSSSKTTTPTTGQSGKTTTPTKEVGKAGEISKIEYDKLQYGSTYEKIKGLLGDTGEVVTESGTKGNIGYTVTYHIKTSGSGEVFLAFKDNKLVNKMEVNLK